MSRTIGAHEPLRAILRRGLRLYRPRVYARLVDTRGFLPRGGAEGRRRLLLAARGRERGRRRRLTRDKRAPTADLTMRPYTGSLGLTDLESVRRGPFQTFCFRETERVREGGGEKARGCLSFAALGHFVSPDGNLVAYRLLASEAQPPITP
jgi:hypothetical protein